MAPQTSPHENESTPVDYDLTCWYLNQRRVLELLGALNLAADIKAVIAPTSSGDALQQNMVLSLLKDRLTEWLRAAKPPTLGQLIVTGKLQHGAFFTRYTNYYCKGLSQVMKALQTGSSPVPMAEAYAKLDGFQPGQKISFRFNHDHLTSTSSWSELSGQRRLLVLGAATSSTDKLIEAIPWVIADPLPDLLRPRTVIGEHWNDRLEVHVDNIDSFARVRDIPQPQGKAALDHLENIREQDIYAQAAPRGRRGGSMPSHDTSERGVLCEQPVRGPFAVLEQFYVISVTYTVLVCSFPVSTVHASGSIVITPDGTTVFVVNPDSGSVAAIDTASATTLDEIMVGRDPRSLASGPDGQRLYVTNQASATLTILDIHPLALRAALRVGPDPYGVVADPTGRLVYVAATGADRIDVVDTELIEVVDTIAVEARPKGLAIADDGTQLYVTHELSGAVSVIDLAERRVRHVITTGPESNRAQRIVLHPPTNRAYLPHIRSNVSNPHLLFDTTLFPVLSVIDLTTNQHLLPDRLDLSVADRPVNLPFDVALSADGQRAHIVYLGSGDLSVIDLTSRTVLAHLEVGDGPRSIVLTPDERTAYIANSLSGDVSVIDLTTFEEVARIPTTTSPLSPQLRRGKLLFISSRSTAISRDRWMSCESCHFDGEHDGRTWLFPDGPRNTTNLRGLVDTRPLHWSADRDEVQDFEFTIRELQAGTGLLEDPHPELGPSNTGRSADLDALAAFIESLQPRPSPFRQRDGTLTPEAERGQAVFHRADVGCATCHAPPLFTDLLLHDIGTGGDPGELLGPGFDTPSLRGIWHTAPYLHDGRAPTLHDVITTYNPHDRHSRTAHLSEAELQDLLAFLLSVEGATSRVQDLERVE